MSEAETKTETYDLIRRFEKIALKSITIVVPAYHFGSVHI